ncbi:sodium-dependent transporter [Acetobacterium wieringae]|uniref:Transporter n=1 Tax=Acetobacterium wieringae TaxID=52694 RepID=A0A1F2PI41_9FIRM|nr:sodium-dependent transporter [Acetobacterium wieringae]OFV70990.1 sodium:neurotransmitter symporter family protein [Acetobacterium wieringae]
MDKRSEFSSKIGFVLAAAGSAVGLGNIWRFPYLAAKYGGGLFLVIYLIFVLTLGFTIMTAELAIGRKAQLSPMGAYRALDKRFGFVGVIASLVAFLILPYYSVIGGWVIKYFLVFVSGGGVATTGADYFSSYIARPFEPIIWQAIFVLATTFVVIRGVKDGIEKASKILMPILIVLSVFLSIYSIMQPGAMAGVWYFLYPDLVNFSFQAVLAAMGQMFYSLSLAMGIMVTYGSYLSKKDDLETSVKQIELFDAGIAILAGFMIIPAVFAFSGGDPTALNKGPGLMFVTLPKVFETMGFGNVMGGVFFLLVLFAALTSSISLMEAVVATVCDQFKWERKKGVLIVTVLAILIGIPSSLGQGVWSEVLIFGFNFLDFFDFITNSVLMPVGAFFTCILVGHVLETKIITDEVKLSSPFKREKLFIVMVKYIAPLCIVAILISSILEAMGVIKY